MRADRVPSHADVRYGNSRIGNSVMLVIVIAVVIVPICLFDVSSLFPDWPYAKWLAWPIIGAVLLIGVSIWYAVLRFCFWSLRCSFRSCNWFMKVCADGLYLKYRSYTNDHFDPNDETVVFIPYDEIASVSRGFVETTTPGSDQIVRVPVLEIDLEGQDSEELRRRIAEENAREGPEVRYGFVTAHSRSNHCPISFARSGVIRVEWRRSMLRALSGVVAVTERSARAARPRVELVADIDPNSDRAIDARILDLVERGEKLAAIRLLRQHRGMSLSEAKRFSEELLGELARR